MITVTLTITESAGVLEMGTGRFDHEGKPATPREVAIGKQACECLDQWVRQWAKDHGADVLALENPKRTGGN